jgi:hypothetical protein
MSIHLQSSMLDETFSSIGSGVDMKVKLLWHSTARRLVVAGRAIGRFFGPFPPVEPGARFTPNFRVHASYGRFVFSMHALAPRLDPACQVDVHDAYTGAQAAQVDWPARHPGEMALLAKAPRRPSAASSTRGRTILPSARSDGLPVRSR